MIPALGCSGVPSPKKMLTTGLEIAAARVSCFTDAAADAGGAVGRVCGSPDLLTSELA
jgi:hypothetical protein